MVRIEVAMARASNAVDGSDLRQRLLSEVDLVRMHVPVRNSGHLDRRGLITRLGESGSAAVVLVSAPAGYGKTTLLSQWAAAQIRSVAWLSLGESDNDPIWFLRNLAVALDEQARLPDDVLTDLLPGSTVPTRALSRLRGALDARPESFMVVLDDCHLIHEPGTLQVIEALIDAMPVGSQIVLAGRAPPAIPLGRRRLDGSVAELHAEDLVLGLDETATLISRRGLDDRLDPGVIQEWSEGWPAGVSLSLIAASSDAGRQRPSEAGAEWRPATRLATEYLTEEVLSAMDAEATEFLLRTSILDRMNGSLCDHVLGVSGSAAVLEELAWTTSSFLLPLDDRQEWYRCHRLLADLLRSELERTDPLLERELHSRASKWCEEHGHLDRCIRHAVAAGELDRAVELIVAVAGSFSTSARHATLNLWLDLFEASDFERFPGLAAARAAAAVDLGDVRGLAVWLSRAAQDSAVAVDIGASWVDLMSMVTGSHPIEETSIHTEPIRAQGPNGSPWWYFATGIQGTAEVLMGNISHGRQLLEDAMPGLDTSPPLASLALSYLAFADATGGHWAAADSESRRATETIEANQLQDHVSSALGWAVRAIALAHQGRPVDAESNVARALAVLDSVGDFGATFAHFRFTVYACLSAARLRMGDMSEAARHARAGLELVPLDPGATVPSELLDSVWRAIETHRDGIYVERLTPAEQRVLDRLPTNASIQDIANDLVVSRNTVKTHALAIYRKLGVGSRRDAVIRARELRLLEGPRSYA